MHLTRAQLITARLARSPAAVAWTISTPDPEEAEEEEAGLEPEAAPAEPKGLAWVI